MDPEAPTGGQLRLTIYWDETKDIASLKNLGFYSAGWPDGFRQAGAAVDRTIPARMFRPEFSPNTADWHLYLPGTPKFFEGGDFQIFNPPREGKRAILLEEDIHFKIHHLVMFCQIYDLVIVHDWISYQAVRATGATNILWVPAAFDPEIFHPLPGEATTLKAAFLGDQGKYYHKRWLCRADYAFRLNILYGNDIVLGTSFYGPSANEWYNRSKVCLDFPTYENLGPRVPQILGSGRLLLMNRLIGINPATTHGLVEGVHYDAFDGSLEELEEKINYYDTHPDEREKIAAAGHAMSLHFTYGAVTTKIVEAMRAAS